MSLPVSSLADQLRSILSSAVSLEQSLAEQTVKMSALAADAARLSADNAALRQQLADLTHPTAPPPVVTPPAPAATEWGTVANETDTPAAFAPALTRLQADGGRWLRLWHPNFGQITAGTARLVSMATAAGLNVILCVQPKDTDAANLGSPDFAGFVKTNAAVLRQLAYVEAGNELNLNQYRPNDLGTAADWHEPYVDRWLRPLNTALKTIGVKTLCTSVTDTYHPQTYATHYAALLAAGAKECCDGLAVHAYFLPQYLQSLADILADLNAAWARPIYVTECNVLTRGLTPAAWRQQLPAYVAVLRRANVAAVQFYRGFPKANGKWAWPTLFDNAGRPTDAYATFLDAIAAPPPAAG